MYYIQGTQLQYFLKSFSISNRKSVKILTNQYSWRHCNLVVKTSRNGFLQTHRWVAETLF